MDSLALAWLGIIAFIIIMYIVLDGFTLGVGLLFPWVKGSQERDDMIATVLPVWDGNETWLVFAGAALYAGFPGAFGPLMSALYLPILLLILGLLFRGISFEFIHKATTSVHVWEKCFFSGSLMAVIAQGIIVGSYVQGFSIDVSGNIVAPNLINWFNLFCAAALVVGYTMLGSARLIKKVHAPLQEKLFAISGKLQWVLFASILFVGFYSPVTVNPQNYTPWFQLNDSPFMLMFTIVIVILMLVHMLGIKYKIENLPFLALVGTFIMAYTAFVISDLPYIVPHHITFLQAKADDSALRLMLYGAAVLIPLLLSYTAYAYYIFGGKIDEQKKVRY
jgi:cytochrome d ubiquinol oxidase subunit II